jgi:hypothetical protein
MVEYRPFEKEYIMKYPFKPFNETMPMTTVYKVRSPILQSYPKCIALQPASNWHAGA